MKTKVALSVLAGLVMSASALASTPQSYDTRFNVSANVPDSAKIIDPSGKPVTEVDVVLVAKESGYMEAETDTLKLWNNDVTKLDVSLVLDDSQSATGEAFTLYSTQGGTLNTMTYKISTVTTAGTQEFAKSGDSKNYALTAQGTTHADMPLRFRFVSDKTYDALGQGNYTGVVYANVVANP